MFEYYQWIIRFVWTKTGQREKWSSQYQLYLRL